MTMLRLTHMAVGIAILLVSAPALPFVAQAQQANGSNVIEKLPGETPEPPAGRQQEAEGDPEALSEEIKALERRLDEVDDNFEWYGLLIAVVGIGFGALVTVTVVFFALRTEKSAIWAAKEELRSSKAEIDSHVEAAQTAADSATHAAREIEDRRNSAIAQYQEIEINAEKLRDIVAKATPASISEGEPERLTQDEKDALGAAASELSQKPRSQLTADEFEVLLAQAFDKRQWYDARDLAEAFRLIHHGPESVAYALLTEGGARARTGDLEGGLTAFDELIKRFGAEDSPVVKRYVAQALYNRALALGKLGRSEEAIVSYSDVIERYDKDPSQVSLPTITRALGNRANKRRGNGDFDEALKDYDRALDLLGDKDDPHLIEPAIKTRLGKARAEVLSGKPAEAVETLSDMLRRFPKSDDAELKGAIKSARQLRAKARKELREQRPSTPPGNKRRRRPSGPRE